MDSPVSPPAGNFAAFAQGGWQDLEFGAFREGVEDLHPCWRVEARPWRSCAIAPRRLRCRNTCTGGWRRNLVLEGSRATKRGDYPVGSLVLNPEGTVHSVRSEEGCVVLIQWDRPVEILEGR